MTVHTHTHTHTLHRTCSEPIYTSLTSICVPWGGGHPWRKPFLSAATDDIKQLFEDSPAMCAMLPEFWANVCSWLGSNIKQERSLLEIPAGPRRVTGQCPSSPKEVRSLERAAPLVRIYVACTLTRSIAQIHGYSLQAHL